MENSTTNGLSGENQVLHVSRDLNGRIVIVSPTRVTSRSSRQELRINHELESTQIPHLKLPALNAIEIEQRE